MQDKLRSATNKVKKQVSKVNKQMNVMEAFTESDARTEFIKNYGIELEMPANYIHETFFYQPDMKYIINACSSVFPDSVEFYDFDKLGNDGDPTDSEYIENERHFNNRLSFKVYSQETERYQQIKNRLCDSSYQNKICFSEDKTQVAIFRKDTNVDPALGLFKRNQAYVIDIFDCSSIDFFLRNETLTPKDPNLIITINDKHLHNTKKLEDTFFKFSPSHKYLYIIHSRHQLRIYDISQKGQEIKDPIVSEALPAQYEVLVNISINEEELSKTVIAAKKTDFRNIDFFELGYWQAINKEAQLEARLSLNNSKIHSIQMKFEAISTIRVENFNIQKINLRFSKDHSKAIMCDGTQNIVIELAKAGKKLQQKTINHLDNKTCRLISRHGDQDFLVVTANAQDKEVSIRLSSDCTKKIEFFLRFVEGPVQIRDVYSHGDKVRILITRDDEQFFVYEYENFERETYVTSFFECSNYIFEWPYVCYLRGNSIYIQNGFDPTKAVYFNIKNMNPNSYISHMFLTETYQLYVIVSNKDEYLIFEKDLDKISPLFFKITTPTKGGEKHKEFDNSPQKSKVTALFSKIGIAKQETPIAKIPKDLVNYKQIYKFFVRSSSSKEIIQTNLERVMFFICDFKLYCIQGNNSHITLVDRGYKFKKINSNLMAYNTVDKHNKKTNVVKLLCITNSEYFTTKVYEEFDGQLVEFLVQENELMVLTKPPNCDDHVLKIFKIVSPKEIKIDSEVVVRDPKLIGFMQSNEQIQNNMIPAGNELYHLVKYEDKVNIHNYKNVVPISTNSGDQMLFISPLFNATYRRMVYFITNKMFQKTKRAIILPYLNDNYILFNKRDNLTQFCKFFEPEHLKSAQQNLNILNYVPYTQTVMLYSQKGQLMEIYKMKKFFLEYGDQHLAVSQNGENFLVRKEDDQDFDELTVLNISLQQDLGDKDKQSLTYAKQKTSGQKEERSIYACVEKEFELYDIPLNIDIYQKLKKFYLNELILYYSQRECEIVYRINDNLDLMIGFLYTSKIAKNKEKQKYLKELVLVKNGSVYRVRLPYQREQETIENQQKEPSTSDLTSKLLKEYTHDEGSIQDQEYALFLAMNELQGCYNFCLTNDKVILYSKDKIFHGDLDNIDSVTHTFKLKQSKFEIENTNEAHINNISVAGQNGEDSKNGNYYIYIKVNFESTYSFYIKYNINKNKEFSSFDCSLDSQAFFDNNYEGYLLNSDSIIDIDQGIPLYFYKTGMKDYDKRSIMTGSIDRGPRFCSKNNHFMIKNRVYIPYSYFILVLIQNNMFKPITCENWDQEAFYRMNGSTVLHSMANNHKNLEFILKEYEKNNPKLLNLLLLKDNNGQTALSLAMAKSNSRCVNLILDVLTKLSMNNIHALKDNFVELLDYQGFEKYISLCFFQNDQMSSKQIFQRRSVDEDQKFFIAEHDTSFLDKNFYEKFQDLDQPMRPVVIKGLDCGWMLKYKAGLDFQMKLSESENMSLFQIDTIRLIVNYQWEIMKPKIINWLFIPFIINMTLFNIYCLYTFEGTKQYPEDSNIYAMNLTVQIILVMFTVQTVYVELQQIIFHRHEYIRSFWNLLDLTTVVMTPLIVIFDLMYDSIETDQIIRSLMAVCNIIFFLRFFYFLRIFDTTSHLVRTIVEITFDIRNFLFVFCVGVFGFGASFYILANNAPEDNDEGHFIKSFSMAFIYSYRLSLGDFDTDGYSQTNNVVLLWVIFVVCSMFTAIILLNMLVAIMGESFNRVNETADSQTVREHLQLILENDFLIDRRKQFGHVKFLIEVKDDIEEDTNDTVPKQLEAMERVQTRRINCLNKDIGSVKDILKGQNLQMLHVKNDITQLKVMLSKFIQEQHAHSGYQHAFTLDTLENEQ